MPPWMIAELEKEERAAEERRRQEDAARPRVYAPEPPRHTPAAENNHRGVFRIQVA